MCESFVGTVLFTLVMLLLAGRYLFRAANCDGQLGQAVQTGLAGYITRKLG